MPPPIKLAIPIKERILHSDRGKTTGVCGAQNHSVNFVTSHDRIVNLTRRSRHIYKRAGYNRTLFYRRDAVNHIPTILVGNVSRHSDGDRSASTRN